MRDFKFAYIGNSEWPDHLICRHCNQRVERGIYSVSDHWLRCSERKEGIITARTSFERKLLDSWSINVDKQ